MLYAKINIEGKVLEYPLTADVVRARNLETSLPYHITEKALPFGFVIVKTSDGFNIDEKFKEDVEEYTPQVKERFKVYTIDISKAHLEGIEEGSPEDLILNTEKKKRLIALSNNIDKLVSELTASYKTPEAELKSWDLQLKEALLWLEDPLVETPLLTSIAKQRGVDESILKAKVLEKATRYKKLIGYLVGRKQYLEDSIENASSLSVLESIQSSIDVEDVINYLNSIKE